MAKDFYIKSAKAQMQAIETARANTLAELEQARQNNDKYSAGQSVQALADLAAAQENLQRLTNEYVRSQQPVVPREPTPEERRVRRIEDCDWGDVVSIARQSKYASNIRPDDPGLLAGWQEAQRRRARGE